MIGNEQIAKEAAEKLVEVAESAVGWRIIYVGPSVHTAPFRDVDAAEARAARCVEHLAKGVLAAVERSLRQPLTPGGLSEGRLAEIQHLRGQTGLWTDDVADPIIDDLLAELHLLRRILSDDVPAAAVREAYEAGRLAGFREGAEAQKAADAEAVRDLRDRLLGTIGYGIASGVLSGVMGAKPVEPPAKEGR